MITEILKNRFYENMTRHPDLEWDFVEDRLNENREVLEILKRMEESGGEPDTIGIDEFSGKIIFCDCSSESPVGRRSLCYDDEALEKRKKNPPAGSAMHQSQEMGVSMLTEELYRRLQELGSFDQKTSSWIFTPEDVRGKGGALFCERRYGVVFTFHNGADSYYSVRGWRGYVMVWYSEYYRTNILLNHEMFIAGSNYWNMAYGQMPGDMEQDEEGMNNMRNLGQNMAFCWKHELKKSYFSKFEKNMKRW